MTRLVLLALFLTFKTTTAEVVDYAAAGGDFLAVDDEGRVWLFDEEMPGHGCVWHLLDATFPGATHIELTRDTSGSFLGAITTSGGSLLVVNWIPSTRTFLTMSTRPLPTTDVVELAFADHTGPFWLRDSSGGVWHGRFVGPTFTWFGPCAGPSGPVGLDQDSWGSVKAAHR